MSLNRFATRRDGNEIWKSVPGYEGLYEVSNYGSIRSLVRMLPTSRGNGVRRYGGRNFSPRIHANNGYVYVQLSRHGKHKGHRLHKLIARAFLGERPPGYHIDHIDCDRTNNAAENLRYITCQENIAHKCALGRQARGSRQHSSKLDERMAAEIRHKLTSYVVGDYTKLGREYGVDRSIIARIHNGRAWTHA